MDPERARGLTALCRDGLDWQVVLRQARRHGVMPLLSRHLGAVAPGHVPPAVLVELGAEDEANAVRNRFLAARLRAALDTLAGAGVVALAFKGPTLALGAYGDLSLRRFEDLDLLVRREDVLVAKRQLVAHGYRPLRELTRAEETKYLDSEYEYGFLSDRGRVRVELHWNVVPRAFSFQLDADRVWKAARTLTLDGGPVLVPAPEDLLLILSLHGAKHLWERIGWICDVAELVRAHPDLDWPGCLANARARGVERIVLVGLFLAGDLLGATLPVEIVERIRRDRAVATLGRRVAGWLAAGAVPAPRSMAGLGFATAMRERMVDRLRYAVRLTLTPTIDDWAEMRLPASLFFLHYPLRPLRLALKYGTRALVGR
jgi:hypothetical protein